MKKGQLLSLDLLVALIIITASTGILLHWTEEQSALLKEKQLQAQIFQVAELSANRLVSNKDIICKLVDGSGTRIGYLNNCIPENGAELEFGEMGIPHNDFNCMVDSDINGANLVTKCLKVPTHSMVLSDLNNYYAVTRKVVYWKGAGENISQTELSKCKPPTAGCQLKQGKITVYVWSRYE